MNGGVWLVVLVVLGVVVLCWCLNEIVRRDRRAEALREAQRDAEYLREVKRQP